MPHHLLGAVYFQQKKYPESIACARAAIKADPRLSNAYLLLGLALQQTGDIAGARVALTEAARLDPRWKSLLAMLECPPPQAWPPHRNPPRHPTELSESLEKYSGIPGKNEPGKLGATL